MYIDHLKCCGTIDQAEAYVRELVAEDCNRIGITDWTIINKVIATKNHQYMIVSDMEFDDVGNLIRQGCYYVCLRTSRSRAC